MVSPQSVFHALCGPGACCSAVFPVTRLFWKPFTATRKTGPIISVCRPGSSPLRN